MRAMIQFYAEDSVGRVLDTTAPQLAYKLELIFSDLEKGYGVRMAERSIDGLDGEVLKRWLSSLKKAHKPATVNNYVSILKPFLRWAYATTYRAPDGSLRRYVDADFSDSIHCVKVPDAEQLPPEQRPKDKYYTHEQVSSLLYTDSGRNRVRDRAIMAMILYGGFRVSEICALTIGQATRTPGVITLRRKGGAWCDAEISPEAYEYLNAYLATRPDRDNPNAPLFLTSHGKPCTRQQIYKAFSHKQQALGLATGPHALRHTAISEVANTCGAVAARDFANHKAMTVTNRYSHTTKEQRQAAANRLNWGERQ